MSEEQRTPPAARSSRRRIETSHSDSSATVRHLLVSVRAGPYSKSADAYSEPPEPPDGVKGFYSGVGKDFGNSSLRCDSTSSNGDSDTVQGRSKPDIRIHSSLDLDANQSNYAPIVQGSIFVVGGTGPSRRTGRGEK